MELIGHLATTTLFEGLPPKQHAALAATSVRFSYEKGQKIFSEGDEATIAGVKTGVGMIELEEILHGIIRDGGHGDHLFGPTMHGVGIEFEEAPLPPGHAFFHGEKAPPPLAANVVIAVGNCGRYTGPWGVRVEDTVVEKPEGAQILTDYVRQLEI